MKRKALAGAVFAICLSLLAYGTIAYFTAEETAHNVITTGGIKIELLEWADAEKTTPFPKDGLSAMPDTNAVKIVEVKNTGNSAAYIRVKVDKSVKLAPGVSGETNPELIGLNFNETHWTFRDGFYYYEEALAPGETTAEPLLTSVSFDKSMGNLYQNCKVEIDITAYATQAANNGTSALTAGGWPNAE